MFVNTSKVDAHLQIHIKCILSSFPLILNWRPEEFFCEIKDIPHCVDDFDKRSMDDSDQCIQYKYFAALQVDHRWQGKTIHVHML